MKPEAPAEPTDPRLELSALADGEADAQALLRSCEAWANAASEVQHTWHAYHLIGDVLRSEDLASAPARDRAFLDRLRVRLADEPAIPAIAAVAATPPRDGATARAPRKAWAMPLAMAAGVMALAVGLVVALAPSALDNDAAPQLAAAPADVAVVAAEGARQSAAVPTPAPQAAVGSVVVRDAQLDHYLRAHREYGAALPGSLPGGAGRSIANVSFER